MSCYPVTACTVAGLSAQPPCYWNSRTLAGNGSAFYADGTGTLASFFDPLGVAFDFWGNVFVSDTNRIRKITPNGTVTTFAGNSAAAYGDGFGTSASFSQPFGLFFNASGALLVADANNNMIRAISSTGYVSTIAGNGLYSYADGIAASFRSPSAVVANESGYIFVADNANQRIRLIKSNNISFFIF